MRFFRVTVLLIIRRRKAQLAFSAAATIPRLHREFVMVEISTTRL